jgi:hypothetical protein
MTDAEFDAAIASGKARIINSYDDIEDAEPEEPPPEQPAWTKKYIGTPKWFRDNFPGHDEDPCNAFIVILALKSSKLFAELTFLEDKDVLLARVKYWYGEDPEYRVPLDRLLLEFLHATGERFESLADEICQYCFQINLPRTPAEPPYIYIPSKTGNRPIKKSRKKA